MGSFKDWLKETTIGSDGGDVAPVKTLNAAKQVSDKWLSNPQTTPDQNKLMSLGSTHPSALGTPLMKSGATAIKANPSIGKGVSAPSVAFYNQNTLRLPNILKAPMPKPSSARTI